ncbi:MAG: CDP-alcohol phosphatidyltransferase family protein [Candidatus Thorarchaeota archaeon]|jgi:phosphatidylglycerophosphate synthase
MSPSRFRLRKVFRGPVLRVARPFIRMDIHPNSITYLSLLIAFIGFLSLILSGNEILFGILIFAVGFLDGVDGAVARGSGKASTTGAFTDSLFDKAAEALLILAIALRFSNVVIFGLYIDIWAFLCLFGWIMTSYSRSRAETMGVNDLDIGLGARSERLFILFIFSVLYLTQWGLIVVTIIGICTAAYRFYKYREELATQMSKSPES